MEDAGRADDAGATADAGSPFDGGVAADAGVEADAGVVADAGAAADAGAPVDAGACVDTDVLLDDFDGAAFPDPPWRTYSADNGMSLTLVGGALRIVYAQAAGRFAIAAVHPRDVREQRVTLTVVTPPDASTAQQLRLTVGDPSDSGNRVRILLEAGTLYGRVAVADNIVLTAGVPFDAVAHKHWRIREHAGTTTMETSPDGVTWTVIEGAVTATPTYFASGAIQVGGGTNETEVVDGLAEVDDLELGPALGVDCAP